MVEKIITQGNNIKRTCRVLKVSRSGYYAWLKRPDSTRKKQNQELMAKIKNIHVKSRGTYGVPRVKEKLKSEGTSCGSARVARLMKKEGLRGIAKKKYRVQTTNSKHNFPVAERVVQTENAKTLPTKPNEVWASDITYVETEEGWLYLAIFLDLFTRKIVGFSMNNHMRTELVLNALEMALGRQHREEEKLVGHSDRGVQYASESYRNRLQELNITASMSRKGNCYDNAYAESFFHTLKVELVHRRNFKTRKEAMQAIFEYIEVWYNRERMHSSLGYKTPTEYEQIHLAA